MKRFNPVCAKALSENYEAELAPSFQGQQALNYLRRVIDGYEHQRMEDVVVPAALKKANAADYAHDKRIVAELAALVARELARFADRTELFSLNWTNAALDEAFASYVEVQLGKKGAQWAQIIRRDARERTGPDKWRLWRQVDTGETYLIGMTKILWGTGCVPSCLASRARPARSDRSRVR